MSDSSKPSETRVNNFDVLKELSRRDLGIAFSDEILRLRRVKAGTQVTVGIGDFPLLGDTLQAIADGRLVGGLMLWDREQYRQILAELQTEQGL